MSKRQFKSQASSSRAVSGTWGTQDAGFSSHSLAATSVFGNIRSSPLSYVYEPPDLSKISEPNVVVALKNLQKKDSITKSKALEDIQAYVLSIRAENGGIEEAILEVWVGLPAWVCQVQHNHNIMLLF